jgi:hypothetical protein
MEKNRLSRFISKYNLAGLVESVAWNSEGGKLSTKFVSDDKTVLGVVTLDSFDFEDATVGVYNTNTLKSLLNVLGNDVQIDLKKIDEKPISLSLTSDSTTVQYQLADLTVIPNVPDLKQLPEFGISIDLDANFIDKFIKAKSALSDVDNFTVLTEKGKLKIVIGYSNINTNRVDIVVNDNFTEEVKPISFSAKYLKEIFSANKEANSVILNVSTSGLAHVEFKIDDFTAKYFLVEVQLTN